MMDEPICWRQQEQRQERSESPREASASEEVADSVRAQDINREWGNNERERRLVQGAGTFNREGARTGAIGSKRPLSLRNAPEHQYKPDTLRFEEGVLELQREALSLPRRSHR